MRFLLAAVAAAVLLLSGCSRGVENKEAVRQAILAHLSERGMNVGSMQVDVVAVTFRENEADATVAFAAKGGQGGQPMTMNYTLAKKGDGWVVKSRSEAGGAPHGAAGQMPGAMPPGHPDVGGAPPAPAKK